MKFFLKPFRRPVKLTILLVIAAFSGTSLHAQSIQLKDTLLQNFVNPSNQSKPWAFFWWFNGYVDKPSITRHLEALKEKGIGGVLLYPSINEPTIPQGAKFMSPQWRELFKHAVKEAHRLNLQMGVNICNGWPAGGAWITPESNSWATLSATCNVQGPRKLSMQLPEPLGKHDIYHDVIIQAVPVDAIRPDNSVHLSSSCDSANLKNLGDGNYYTIWAAKARKAKSLMEDPQWIQYDFKKPTSVDNIWVGGICFAAPTLVKIMSSADGVNFKKVATFNNASIDQFQKKFTATKARFFRVVFQSNSSKVLLGELAIGKTAAVNRITQMAVKLAKNGPTGVHSNTYKYQLNFVYDKLNPLPNDKPISRRKVIDVTKYCDANGKIEWNVPPGKWQIIRIGETNTRVIAGDGLLMNYMSAKGTADQFNKFMKLLIADVSPYAGTTLKYFHEDNNEIKGPYNWTPGFMDEFKRLRGYDMKPYAATLTGRIVENAEITDRFLQDYRRTIADLVATRHYQDLADSIRHYGMGMDSEAGGQYLPFMLDHDALMNLGRMDIPVAEFWESPDWKENQYYNRDDKTRNLKNWVETAQNINAKQASSAAHIYGKKIIASEAFTSMGTNAHWRAAPADLLLNANIAFCEGINRFVLHSSTTQKEQDGKPGYEYKAGTHFNQNVTWWKDIAPFFKYISRCQTLLQQGLFVADVLYYNGDDIPNIVLPKHIPTGLGFGYDYDVCNTEVLLSRLSVKNGRLTLPDGMSYKVLVLPDTKDYNVKALEKIKQLVAAGAIIVGAKPEKAMGLQNYPASDGRVKKIAATLWGNTDGKKITCHQYGQGKVYWGATIKEVLEANKTKPDFVYHVKGKDNLLDFIHRNNNDTDIYFIANRRDQAWQSVCSFRISGKQPELWDPFTGECKIATAFQQKNGYVDVPLKLNPYGSMFVVFRKQISATKQGTDYTNAPAAVLQQELNGPYQVMFDTAWGGPKSVRFNTLQDWSQSPNDSIRYFSGTAKYLLSFSFNKPAIKTSDKKLILDLGQIRNIAHVWLNDVDLGVVWTPPYTVDITDAILTKNNKLEIAVTNSWVNRLIGDSELPQNKRRTKTNIVFTPKDKLSSSGLLGPVKIYELHK